MDDDKKQQLIDAKKALKNLPFKNHTDLTEKLWKEARTAREECLVEYIKFLETGKKEHIKISTLMPKSPTEPNHFK